MGVQAMGVQAGDRVGQYVLGREIGKGAMATVYEAEHAVLRKRVALKRLHAHLATDATGAERFLREGRAAAQIRSPHVVEVFDVGAHEGVPHLVMELLDGQDLAEHLREKMRLSPREAADLMLPIASAVHAAHLAGVVHRDLKPSNVFLSRNRDEQPWPVILDFGISKVAGDIEHDLTASEAILGTVHYMSPEQTRGARKATPASDQYALGVMLYECVTGIRPFAGNTPYAVMHAIVSAKVAPPSSRQSSVPAALDTEILRAMHRKPEHRFPSVRAFGAALLPWASPEVRERFAADLGADATFPAARTGARATWLALGLLVVATTSIAGLAVRLTHKPRDVASVSEARGVLPPAAPEEPPIAAAPAAPQPPPPVETVGSATTNASERSPARAPHARPGDVPPKVAPAPQRGTNGAIIVE